MSNPTRYKVYIMNPNGTISVRVVWTSDEVKYIRSQTVVMNVFKINEVGLVIG